MAWDATRAWAWDEFGSAALGDFRNTRRVVNMAEQAARSPHGLVSKVFTTPKELEGAYDLLENERVSTKALAAGVAAGCARRCAALPFAWLVVDGSSLSLQDEAGLKGFGPLGNTKAKGCGIKVITSCALDPNGTPMGLGYLQFFVRKPAPRRADGSKQHSSCRKVQDKETQRWIDAVRDTRKVWQEHAPEVRRWWVIDREADSWAHLIETCRPDEWMTIRNKVDRRLKTTGPKPKYLRDVLQAQPVTYEYELDVPDGYKRAARRARMQVRCCRVTLDMRDKFTDRRYALTINVVRTREAGTTPEGEEPLDWVLMTNHPIDTSEDVCLVIFGYTQRWHVEEFHRAWKSAGCCIEDSRLRGKNPVMKWATILAAVAARAERLRILARNEPKLPASVDLTPYEIAALRALHRRSVKKGERIPKMPTIEQAVRWIALLGGHKSAPSAGVAGTISIMRGLERLRDVALGFELAATVAAASGPSASGNPE